MGSDKAPRPAYVEDVEADDDSENNRTIRGTRVSARASKKEKKHRNEKRAAKEKKKSLSDDGYSSLHVQTRADERATVKEVRVLPDREPREGRRKSININPGKSPRKSSSRPPTQQRNVSFDQKDLPSRPKDRDDPRYFGERDGHPVVIQAQSTPRPAQSSASSQSRQSRPMSINPGNVSRPPLSGSAYYAPIYNTAPIMIPPTYPNPMQMAYSPSQPGSPSRKTLEDRFARTGASIARPHSVAEYRPSDLQLVQRGLDYDDYDYDSEAEAEEEEQRAKEAFRQEAMRKEARRRKELQDAQDMPPPPQLMTRRRSVRQPSEQSIFLQDQDDEPQPQPRRSRDDPRESRRSRDFASGDYENTRRPSGDYERPSPRRPSPRRRQSRTSYELDERERPAQPKIMYRGDAPPPQSRARRQSLPRAPESSESLSFAYDRDDANIRVEAASGRRASYYGGLSNPSSNYEDKVRDAAGYQADVSGEPVKLTADMLRKQQQHQHAVGSSRSTHSSNSRDESDFKRSVTTRTTRSVSGNDAGDDVTIRIKGNAKVTIGAAEITNADGVELNIVNNRRQSIRNGSEASRSEYAPSQSQGAPPALSEYAPTATDERERERERKGRREILGAPMGRERTGSVSGRRRGFFGV